jgi:predicted GNAT family N-acyltransferase
MNNLVYTNTMTGEEYNQLRVSVDWRLLSEGQAKRGLENTTFLVVVRDGENAIGMGRVLFDFGYVAYIGDVIVSNEYQGKGIGKSIVESLIRQVLNASESNDMIMFTLGAAKGKEGFYEKLGFNRRPNDYLGCGMTQWVKNN